MANFTKTYIDNLPLAANSKEQKVYWDDKLTGFGVVVGSRSKTFIVQRDVRGRARRKKIGRYSEALTVAKAKATADTWLGELAKGIIPWEAEEAKRKEEAERLANIITLKKAWDSFIKDKEKTEKLSPATLRNYKYCHKQLEGWDNTDISKITVKMVKAKHTDIGTKKGKYLANSVFRLFRTVYNYVIDELDVDLPRNPVRKGLWYEEHRREQNAMKDDVLPVFWKLLDEEIDNPLRRDYYRLVLFTGLRRASASSIKVEDIDLKTKTLFIPNPKGGKKKAFALPLSDYLCKLIEGMLEDNDTKWLFPSRNSKSGHIMEPKEPGLVKKLEEETGHHLMIHGLRNTFITVAADLNINTYAIKLLVNHSVAKSDVTGGYANLDVDRLREPMQRITTRLLSLVKPDTEKKVVEMKR